MRLVPLAAAALVLAPLPAAAHIALMSPTPRHTEQKKGPCGIANDARGDKITVFQPGETIEIVFEEFVNHPGHYRVAFDADGFDDFVDPADFEELYSNDAVILDGIADMQGGIYKIEVTLPEIECDNCTLQVVQVMTDKPPYGDGNDLYYQCADLVLEGPIDTTTTDDSTTGGSDGTTTEPTTTDPTTTGASTTTAGTTGDETGGTTQDPETGGTTSGSASGSATAGSTDAGSTAGSGDSQGSASSTGDSASGGEEPDESGCSCTQGGSDGGFVGGLGLGLFAFGAALGRRRRCG